MFETNLLRFNWRALLCACALALLSALVVAISVPALAAPAQIAAAGSVDTPTPTPTRPSVIIEDTSARVQYDGWRGVSDVDGSNGAYRMSRVANESLRFRFAGDALTWLTQLGPDQGNARVIIDGVIQGDYDLYAPTREYQAQKVFTELGAGTHTFVLKVLGTANPNSRDVNVSLDALLVNGATTEENAPGVQYKGWRGFVNTSASGGSYRQTAKRGAVASFEFTGSSIKWITARGPAYGQARVSIDGMPMGDFDLYSPTQKWQVPIRFSGLGDTDHVIQIRVLGTRSADSAGNAVVVDAFRGRIGASVPLNRPSGNAGGH